MTKPSAREITNDLYRRLRRRYRNGMVLLEGVGNGAGHGNVGWSDAIAMSIWPSKGLRLYGFEVKASRADWARELNQPDKNAEWQACCDEWYVVAAKGVVALEELPAAWGLMIPSGADGLRIVSRSEHEPGARVTRDLVAAVFRAAASERASYLHETRKTVHAEIEARMGRDLETARSERENMAGELRELKSALGGRWRDMDELLATARAVQACDRAELAQWAWRMAEQVEDRATALREAAAALGSDDA